MSEIESGKQEHVRFVSARCDDLINLNLGWIILLSFSFPHLSHNPSQTDTLI